VDDGRTPLVRVSLDGAKAAIHGGDVGTFEIAGDQIVMTASTPSRPNEIYALPIDGQEKPRALSRVNEDLFSKLDFKTPEEIHFKSADGTPTKDGSSSRQGFEGGSARGTTLKGRTTYPLILRIHGGPVSQFMDSFTFEHQYLASLGYVDPTKLGVGGWSYGGIMTNFVMNVDPTYDTWKNEKKKTGTQ
jgi:dipeptidyl aminopeptidase/acylaminoacyl peptidase